MRIDRMESGNLCLLALWIWCLYGTSQAQDDFAFTASQWTSPLPKIRVEHTGDNIVISCQTNQPSATVTLLLHRTGRTLSAVDHFKNRIQQNGQNFTVRLEATDGSNYECQAEHNGRSISLPLGLLIVSTTPRSVPVSFIPDVNPFMLEMGGEHNITCEAEGTGDPTRSYLRWVKRQGNTATPVPSSMVYYYGEKKSTKTFDFAVLMFRQVEKSMAGVYVCIREYSGQQTSKEVTVDVEAIQAPTATLTEASSVEIIREGAAKLAATCTVSGSPRPQRNWYKDNVIVYSCPDLTVNTCYLDIYNPKFPKDNGTYICRAVNAYGIAETRLDLIVQVSVSLEKPAQEFLYGNKDIVDVYCQVKRANPLPRISWQLQPYDCGPSKCLPKADRWEALQDTAQVYPEPTSATNESRLTVPASIYSSFYRCIAENSFSQDTFEFAIRRIESRPPFFAVNDISPKLDEKTQMNLTCNAEFNKFSGAKWFKDGNPLLSNVSVLKDGMWIEQLNFMPLEISDSGNYTCVAKERSGGQRSLWKYLTVLALLKPTIQNFVDQVAFEEDGTVSIICNSLGNPEPALAWYYNDQEVQGDLLVNKLGCATSTGGMFFLQSDKQRRELIICTVDFQKHSGRFTCRAENRLGVDVATKTLTVYGAPKILNWVPTYLFELGRTITLFCESAGYPTPNVTWYKVEKDGTLQPLAIWVSHNNTAIAEIPDASDSSHGNYSCVSYNKYGRTQKYMSVLHTGTVSSLSGKVSSSMVAGLVSALVLVILCAVVFIIWYRRRLEKKYAPYLAPNANFQLNPDKSLFEQCSELPYDPDWEFPRDRLTFLKVLGSGAFGQVWLAEAQGILAFNARDKSSLASKRRAKLKRSLRYSSIGPYKKRKQSQAAAIPDDFMEKTQVAVKTLKEDASESDYKDLASELKILIHLGEHKNIVNMLGACTQSGKLCVIIEYCPHGNLLNFLRARREIFEPMWFKNETDMENECTYADLTVAAYQIAKGMDFLASKKCVHRDVAARNVLVGVDFIMKIADFGLARDIYKDEFYLKSTSGLLPVKWMSPESLFDKIYTEQSDVWSYGILLWEIFTLGGSPYPGLPTEELFTFLQDNRRMDQPELCPLEVYAIMRDCWERSPPDRPLFSQIADRLGSILSKHAGKDTPYVDFNEGPDHEPQDTDYLIPEKMKEQNPDDYLRIKDEARVNGYDPNSPTPPLPINFSFDEGIGYPMQPPPYLPQNYLPMQRMGTGYSNLPSDGRRTESSISSNEVIV